MKNISSAPYLSGYTYRTLANHAICDKGDTVHMQKVCNGIDPNKIKSGDLLYVTGNRVKEFFSVLAPQISVPFSVITAQWDAGPDKSFISLFPDNLVKWFVINAHIVHKKVVPIPLGLQNLNWKRDGNIQSNPDSYRHRSLTPKTAETEFFASFSLYNNVGERTECLREAHEHCGDLLKVRNFTQGDRDNDVFVHEYLNEAARHKFILCPWGAGIDTHRLWEALYLGCIPITKWHSKVFRDIGWFPIIFVDEWSELKEIITHKDAMWKHYKTELKTEHRIYIDSMIGKINACRDI